jgi:DNA-binding phage protein
LPISSIEWSLAIQTFTNRLQRMSKALGGVSKLAEKAELNINAFYRTRSTQGNPELKGPSAALRACSSQPARCAKRGLNHGSTGGARNIN